MKKIISVLLMIVVPCLCFSQKKISMPVSGHHFKGYVFSKDYYVFGYSDKRCDLTLNDIKKSESIMHAFFAARHMKKIIRREYIRQYFGFLDENGHKIVYINLIRRRSAKQFSMSTEYVSVYDGGDDFWNILIDLNEEKVINYNINGVAQINEEKINFTDA